MLAQVLTATTNPSPPHQICVPDTTDPAVLIGELFGVDGPYSEYADQWVRVGYMVPFSDFVSSVA